ncbi:MAG: hypothetical protein NTAFB01_09830 [Nitrospira sp.]
MAVLVMAAAATGLVGLLWLALPQLVDSWERATYDLRLHWQGSAHADDHIVIISRDEESERDSALGPGLWDRARFAEVITALTQTGTRTIALDFHMPAISPQERGNGKSDQALVNATKSGRVLYPIVTEQVDDAAWEPSVQLQSLTRLLPSFSPDLIRLLPRAGRIEGPFPTLAAVVDAVGDIAAWPDADGTYRRVPTFIGVGDRAVPTFGVAMAASFLEVASDDIELVLGEALRFRNAKFPDGRQQTISIPVDAEGRLLIRYAGQWSDYKIPNVRFLDVFNLVRQGGHEAELRELFSNKLVLMIHAGLASDRGQTPYEGLVPGGFILANIANTILTQQAMREASSVTNWGLVFGLSLCTAGVVVSLPGWFGVIGVVGLVAGYTGVAFLVMPFVGLVLPVLAPLVSLGIAAILALGWVKGRATDQAMRLEQDYKTLQRGLATKQNLLIQQETRVDQLKAELTAAQEAAAKKEEGQAALERTMAMLQQSLQTAQHEVGETGQLVKELQGKLDVMRPAKLDQDVLAVDEQEQLRQECKTHDIITSDPVMLNLWKLLRKAARFNKPVMILGESGTGKELFAKAVHKLSRRVGDCENVNCAGIPETLIESELFGYRKGAHSTATSDYKGAFLRADNSTIFLDEIGELKPDLQAKLLRVLQESKVMRLGDSKPTPVNIRVVVATNRDLERDVADGQFREDLYYRLNVITLRLPPLRERPGDIPILAKHFVDQMVQDEHLSKIELSQGAIDRLKSWPWSGNVRELKNVLEKAIVFGDGSVITEQDLGLGEGSVATPTSTTPPLMVQDKTISDLDPEDCALLQILRRHAFDMGATATELGRDRSTVMEWLKGMCFQALVQHEGDELTAAASLAGEPGLAKLVLDKLKEYVEPLRKIVSASSSPETARAECKKRFKNMPKRYFSSVEALIQKFWLDCSVIQSGPSDR